MKADYRMNPTGDATALAPPSLAELVARAIEKAGDIRYSLVLGTLGGGGGVTSWTLTYADGSGSFDFDTDAAAREHVTQRRRLAVALAALAVIEGARTKALSGPWKVVVSDWGYPNILPAHGMVLGCDSVAEFRVSRQKADGQAEALALAERFVAVMNAHGAHTELEVRHG